MKIGIDISQSVYTGTGVGQYTRHLVEGLTKIDDKNTYVLYGASLRKMQELDQFVSTLPQNRIHKKYFPLPPLIGDVIWNRWHRIEMEKLIGPVDLFHTSDWVEPPAKAKKITTIHDLVVYRYPEYLPASIVETQKRKLAWVKKESSVIIADSQSTKDDITSYLGIAPQKIHVVHLGVGEEFVPQPDDQLTRVKRKFGIEKNFVLSVGTREPRKNLPRVIAAFQKLQKSDLQLVIVGNPGWGEEVKMSKNTVLVEHIPVTDLTALYSATACFVYPSLYEGFGLPILEAMACGTIVVTSDRGSLKEVADSHAIVVNPELTDSIAKGVEIAFELPVHQRRSMIEKGIQHAKSFTWEKTARKTLELYMSLIH